MDNTNIATCPFCPFSDSDQEFVAQHIEYCHPENGTPGNVYTAPAENIHEPFFEHQHPHPSQDYIKDETDKYVECPHGCGEVVTNTELSTHLDLHFAEDVALEDTDTGSKPQDSIQSTKIDDFFDDEAVQPSRKKDRSGRGESSQAAKKGGRSHSPNNASTGGVKKLGRAELGPHAHEKQMPSWLKRMLEKGAKTTQSNRISTDGTLARHEDVENETAGVIPVLSKLCEQDPSVQRAFFCSPKVRHIFKMPREGGFCGYRNIQMLVSFIQAAQSEGHEHFPGKLPTILELQEMIEKAWDMGINTVGRVETGGIRGTRKFIGTSEAQALFLSLGIPCEGSSITQTTKDVRAHDALYMNVASYFRPAHSLENDKKVVTTDLPPIYFQHQGHSMTIIGFEIRDNGSANLLVFDPMFKTSPAMTRLIGTSTKSPDPAKLLKAYRRGAPYLQKHKVFEILKLSSTQPAPN